MFSASVQNKRKPDILQKQKPNASRIISHKGGFCAKWAKKNACETCKSDKDCNDEKDACWAQKDPNCDPVDDKWCNLVVDPFELQLPFKQLET